MGSMDDLWKIHGGLGGFMEDLWRIDGFHGWFMDDLPSGKLLHNYGKSPVMIYGCLWMLIWIYSMFVSIDEYVAFMMVYDALSIYHDLSWWS